MSHLIYIMVRMIIDTILVETEGKLGNELGFLCSGNKVIITRKERTFDHICGDVFRWHERQLNTLFY